MKSATSEHKALNDMMLYLRNKRVDEVNLIALAVTIGTIMPPKLFDGLVEQLADRFDKKKYFLVTAEDIISYYFKRYHFHEDSGSEPQPEPKKATKWSPFDVSPEEYGTIKATAEPERKRKDEETITIRSIEDLQRFTAVPINPDVVSFAFLKSGELGILSREGDMILSSGFSTGYRVSSIGKPSTKQYGLQRTRLANLKVGEIYVPRLNLADRIDAYVKVLNRGQACFFSPQGAVHLMDISDIIDRADVFKVVELQ